MIFKNDCILQMEHFESSSDVLSLMQNEYFVLNRFNVKCYATINKVSIVKYGTLFLSNLRILFMTESPFYILEIPLATIINESFEQPFLFPNFIKGESIPLPSSNIIEEAFPWQFHFHNGVGMVAHYIFLLVETFRKAPSKSTENTNLAFVDANDPSIILIPETNQI